MVNNLLRVMNVIVAQAVVDAKVFDIRDRNNWTVLRYAENIIPFQEDCMLKKLGSNRKM